MTRRLAETFAPAFLENRHLLILSIVLAFVAGLSAITNMPMLEDPKIVNRNPIIVTTFPGASAERVEALVTEKLEESLEEIEEIKHVRSESRAGISVISIELLDEVGWGESDEIFSRIRDRLAGVEAELPPGASSPFFDDKRDPAAFTLIVGLSWTSSEPIQLGILSRHAEALGDRLRALPGTELTRSYGDVEEEIRVEIDSAELDALGIPLEVAATALSEADAKRPAGVFRGTESDLPLEVEGGFNSVSRVGAVPLREGLGQEIVTISDVAKISKAYLDPPSEIGRINDSRTIFVAARMQAGSRVDAWAEDALRIVNDYRRSLSSGVSLEIVFDQNQYTNERLWTLASNLAMGAFVIVLFVLFLMGWRLALIVGFALPLVSSLTIFAIFFTGGTLQQMSIFGMIIALGLLIDNAIVVVDEVSVRRAAGDTSGEAVRHTIAHLFLPLLASTLTTILAFTPILLLPGGAGDFVGPIAQSVIYAIAFSFLASMTIIVGLAGLFAPVPLEGKHEPWWRIGYQNAELSAWFHKILEEFYRRRVAAVLVALALPLAGFMMLGSLGNEFFPQVDRDMFEVQVWLPNTSSVKNTDSIVKSLHERISKEDGVEKIFWLIGGSFPTVYYNLIMNQDGASHYAQGIIKSASADATERLVPALQTLIDQEFPGAQVVFREFGQGPPVQADVEYRVLGPSLDRVRVIGEELRRTLQNDPDVLHTQATMRGGEPKLWLKADESEARIAQFTLSELSRTLEAKLDGTVGGSVLEDLEELPVRVRFSDRERGSLDEIGSMSFVRAGGDEWTPLEALGELELRPQLSAITRNNGTRSNNVKGYTRSDSLPLEVSARVYERFLQAHASMLGDSYSIEFGGTVEQDQDAKGNLFAYVPILVVAMTALLVLTFRSVFLALVLFGVALSSVGLAFLATGLMGLPISFNTILGIFGLIGVALNDSIVVVNSLVSSKEARAGDIKAVVKEVVGCTRHLISTTLTTIGGFLPLVVIVGGDFWPALAIVLVGGIAGATIVAMLFVPSMFLLIHRPKKIENTRDEEAPLKVAAALA